MFRGKIYDIAAILLLFCCVSADAHDLSDIYRQLDEAIAHSSDYISHREMRIKKLKKSLSRTSNHKLKFDVYYRLFKEYQPYINDSAMVYLSRCYDEATAMNNSALAGQCHALFAKECSAVGMYKEAFDELNEIDRSKLDKGGKKDYYLAFNHLYGELGSYTKLPKRSRLYYEMSNLYRDTLYQYLDPKSDDYLLKKETQAFQERRCEDALAINDLRLKLFKPDSHEYGLVAYYRFLDLDALNQTHEARYWLALSAVIDIKQAVMDQASLWMLANILSKDGDVNRSFNYINYSWKAAQLFGARLRGWQISPILSSIDMNYQKEIRQNNRQLKWLIAGISLLTLFSLMLLYYTRHQRKHVSEARNMLAEKNELLEDVNKQLDSANHDLSESNSKLNESNRVKEEYIGQFLTICGMYIDKMDNFRVQIYKMLKNSQLKEMLSLTRSVDRKNEELDELYENFDKVFLGLFPHFVEDFNSLLKEKDRIKLADPMKLNTPLRVFALIRLGVEDSSKIAEVLHYSLNTIYNYRAKYRNAAIGDRNDLERKVKELGSVD